MMTKIIKWLTENVIFILVVIIGILQITQAVFMTLTHLLLAEQYK
jgi:hypothetical protein